MKKSEIIAEACARWFHDDGSHWSAERIHRKNSLSDANEIFVAKSESMSVAAKWFTDTQKNVSQYKASKALHRFVGSENYIQPIFLDFQNRFFVMQALQAPTLADLLTRKPQENETSILEYVHQAGEWLRNLQQRSRSLRPSLTARQNLTDVVDDRDCRPVAEFAKQVDHFLRAERPMFVPGVWAHGDFQAKNLFCTSGRVVAFDAPFPRKAHPFIDAARFCLMAEFENTLRTATRQPIVVSSATIRTAFLKGYGGVPEHRLALFDAIEDLIALRLWRLFRFGDKGGPKDRAMETLLSQRGLPGTRAC